MSYLVMPEDLLPGGDPLAPSPRKELKSLKPEKGNPAIRLPPQMIIPPYTPIAPRGVPASNTPALSLKKGKKWLALPLADLDHVAVRDDKGLQFGAEQPKGNRQRAGAGPVIQEQTVEPPTRKSDFSVRRVSAAVIIRNPMDMSEVKFSKPVRPSTTKRRFAPKPKKVGPVGGKKQATRALKGPPTVLLPEGTIPHEESVSTLPLALERARGTHEGTEKVVGGVGVEGLTESSLSRGSSSWKAQAPITTIPPTAGKYENGTADREIFSFDRNAMVISNGYGPIIRPQAEPVDGKMLATYLEDHGGRPADPDNPISSLVHRLAILEDAFRKLTVSTNMEAKLREDLQNVTMDFQNKALAEMTALGTSLQALQNTMNNVIHRQDGVEEAIINRMQIFEDSLVEDMGVSGRIVDQFRELRNDTNDRFGELRQIREDVDTLLAESVQCRFRTEHLWNHRTYVGNAQGQGAGDK